MEPFRDPSTVTDATSAYPEIVSASGSAPRLGGPEAKAAREKSGATQKLTHFQQREATYSSQMDGETLASLNLRPHIISSRRGRA